MARQHEEGSVNSFVLWKWQFVEKQKKTFLDKLENYFARVKSRYFSVEDERKEAALQEVIQYLQQPMPDEISSQASGSSSNARKDTQDFSNDLKHIEVSVDELEISHHRKDPTAPPDPTLLGIDSPHTASSAAAQPVPPPPAYHEVVRTRPRIARLINMIEVNGFVHHLELLQSGLVLAVVRDGTYNMLRLYTCQGECVDEYPIKNTFCCLAELESSLVAMIDKQDKTFHLFLVSTDGIAEETNYKLSRPYNDMVAIGNHKVALAFTEQFNGLDIMNMQGTCLEFLFTISLSHKVNFLCSTFDGFFLCCGDGQISKVNIETPEKVSCIKVTQVAHPLDIAYLPQTGTILVCGGINGALTQIDKNGKRSNEVWKSSTGTLWYVSVQGDDCVCATPNGFVYVLKMV